MTVFLVGFSVTYTNYTRYTREVPMYLSPDSIMHVLRQYEKYPVLFPDIVNTVIFEQNDLHTIVLFEVDVPLLRKNPSALLEFVEVETPTYFKITCKPVRLYRLDVFEGELTVYKDGPWKSRLKVDAKVEPSGPVPDFVVRSMTEHVFDQAIKRLKHLASLHQKRLGESDQK